MKGRTYRKEGGKVEEGVKVSDSDKGANWYAGRDSNVKTEAEEPTGFKKGGKVGYKGREHEAGGMHEFDKLKKEKKLKKKDGGSCEGMKSHERLDRPKRASGGKVASGSRSPFAESSKTSERPGFKGMSNIND
jgi:hypothetical protein